MQPPERFLPPAHYRHLESARKGIPTLEIAENGLYYENQETLRER